MSEQLTVIYRGPSGALIAEGHEALRNEPAVWPRDVVERVNAHTDHQLEIIPQPEKPVRKGRTSARAEEPAADEAAGPVVGDSSDHLEEKVPVAEE